MERISFLGTGAALPTRERNASSIHINLDGTNFLLDCGEGTQRRMREEGVGFDLDFILLTHTDCDHVLGLSGLISTLDFEGRENKLYVIAPSESMAYVKKVSYLAESNPNFPIEFIGTDGGSTVISNENFTVESFKTNHRDNPSVGYVIEESKRLGKFDVERALELGVPRGPKFGELQRGNNVELDDGTVVESDEVVGSPRDGRKITYTGDTRPTTEVERVGDSSDVLIHDATYTSEHQDKAIDTFHSTSREAGQVAADASASTLVLTHISSRYNNTEPLIKDAKETFNGEVIVAEDGLKMDVQHSK